MKLLTTSLLILAASAVCLPAQAKPLSLTYVQLQYEDFSVSGDDFPDLDGNGISGEVVIGAVNWYFYGEYGGGDLEGDLGSKELDVHYNQAAAGLGYQKGSETTVAYGRLGLTKFVVDIASIDSSLEDSYNGYGAELGFRHAFRPNMEFNARLEYGTEDPTGEKNSTIGFGLAGIFNVTDRIGLVLDYSDSSSVSSLKAGVRIQFGNI